MAIEQNTQTDPYAEIRDLIRQGETGDANTNPYDSWYGHVPSATPDKPISSMTLDEVYAYQDKLVNATQGLVTYKGQKVGTSAVGQSQFLKSTLQDYAKKLNLPGSTIFSDRKSTRLNSSHA